MKRWQSIGVLLAFTVILFTALRGGLALLQPPQTTSSLNPSPIPAIDVRSYLPADYGLPDRVGAYELLIASTSANTACTGEEKYHLTVVDTSGKFFQDTENVNALYDVLNQSGIAWNVVFQGTLEGVDREFMIQRLQQFNAIATETGECIRPTPTSGGTALPLSTPNYASYLPSTYGLPDKVGAYELRLVHTSENTECMPEGEYRITVADTSGKFFQDTENLAALYEALNQTGIEWQVQYSGGGTMSWEQSIAQNEQWNQSMRQGGCVRTGRASDGIMTTDQP